MPSMCYYFAQLNSWTYLVDAFPEKEFKLMLLFENVEYVGHLTEPPHSSQQSNLGTKQLSQMIN